MPLLMAWTLPALGDRGPPRDVSFDCFSHPHFNFHTFHLLCLLNQITRRYNAAATITDCLSTWRQSAAAAIFHAR